MPKLQQYDLDSGLKQEDYDKFNLMVISKYTGKPINEFAIKLYNDGYFDSMLNKMIEEYNIIEMNKIKNEIKKK